MAGALEITNEVNTSHFQGKTMHSLQYLNLDSKTRICFVLYYSFFSGNISLNPGPLSNPQLLKQEEWRAFGNRRLHLIRFNINSLQPKIDELRDIAERTKAAVTRISESQVDSIVLDPEIYFENYEILCFDRSRHEGGVACYIRSDINYKLNYFPPNEIENISFGMLIPHAKPIKVGIIYRPSNQSKFLDIFEENLPILNTR